MDKKNNIPKTHNTHSPGRRVCVHLTLWLEHMRQNHCQSQRVTFEFPLVTTTSKIVNPFPLLLSPPNHPSLIIEINIPISRGGHRNCVSFFFPLLSMLRWMVVFF
jgi:hypothetical protein